MKLFVDKVSSYEGVETPKGMNVDVEREEEKGVDDPIEFDAKAFMENINDLLSEFLIFFELQSTLFLFPNTSHHISSKVLQNLMFKINKNGMV